MPKVIEFIDIIGETPMMRCEPIGIIAVPYRHFLHERYGDPNNAIKVLKRMFVAAGVAGASSHSLRRTHANTLRRRGVDMMIIKEQLGHSSLATTQRYFDVDPAEARAAIAPLRF